MHGSFWLSLNAYDRVSLNDTSFVYACFRFFSLTQSEGKFENCAEKILERMQNVLRYRVLFEKVYARVKSKSRILFRGVTLQDILACRNCELIPFVVDHDSASSIALITRSKFTVT